MIASSVAKSVARSVASSTASGGGGVSLPSGAIGAWYADEYQSTPRRVIPNAISSTSVSQNLLAAPRRLFANTVYWASTALTITDDAAAGPDGTSGEASTLVASGASWLLRVATGGAAIPAATYTIAAWVKRNTGSDQAFCFSKDNTATRSSIFTATDTWQRFTYTFTLGGSTAVNQLSICNDGSTSANVQICDLELFAGSSDLGTSNGTNPVGHMYLGSNHYATQPAVASSELDLANQGYGQVQLPANLNLSDGFTYVALVKKTASATAYHATLSKAQNFNHFTMTTELSKATVNYVSAVTQYSGENVAVVGMWELLNQGYHVHTIRYDGSKIDWWLDDCLLHRKTGSVTTQTFRDMHVGIVSATSLYAGEKAFSMALYPSALTDEQVLTAASYMQTRATSASLSATNQGRVICFEGDSISAVLLGWPNYYGVNLASPAFLGHNFAVSGSTVATLSTRQATVNLALPPLANRTGRKFVIVVHIGANDLLSLGATTWLANLKAVLQAYRTAGWTVAACTPTPRTQAGFNTQRSTVVTTMRTWGTSDGVDHLIDFADDATMGTDAAASDTLLYSDGLHPTALGQTNLATIAATVLNAI